MPFIDCNHVIKQIAPAAFDPAFGHAILPRTFERRSHRAQAQRTRSDPHRQWWQSFLKDSGGTGFWHETYFRRGGIEAVYDDVPKNIGLMAFAPVVLARGPMFGAAGRAEKQFGERPVLSEEELYGEPET